MGVVEAGFEELMWLRRRAAGDPVAAIARDCGVAEDRIRRVTNPFGPFPAVEPDPAALRAATRADWVALRRRGVTVTDIARRYGVSHQMVSRGTLAEGPFPNPGHPSPEEVESWVAARRARTSIASIAAATGRSAQRIGDATRPHGPFPPPSIQKIPEGFWGMRQIAEMLKVPLFTVTAWATKGYLPPPDSQSGQRPLWRPATIEKWLPTAGLHRCRTCGAQVRQLAIHHANRHRDDATTPPAGGASP